MVSKPFAAVQAAWRFYANSNVTLPQLAGPLVQCAREEIGAACDDYGLVMMDWCQLHFNGHGSVVDRVELAHKNDLGYEMLSVLLVSDRDGSPIAPLGLEVRARQGIHATRSKMVLPEVSQLDGHLKERGEVLAGLDEQCRRLEAALDQSQAALDELYATHVRMHTSAEQHRVDLEAALADAQIAIKTLSAAPSQRMASMVKRLLRWS